MKSYLYDYKHTFGELARVIYVMPQGLKIDYNKLISYFGEDSEIKFERNKNIGRELIHCYLVLYLLNDIDYDLGLHEEKYEIPKQFKL